MAVSLRHPDDPRTVGGLNICNTLCTAAEIRSSRTNRRKMASYARGESPPAFSSKSSFAFPPTSSEAAPYILHLAALSSAAGPSGYVCSTSDPSTGLSLFDERLQPLRKIETGPRQRVTEIKVVQVGGSGDQGVVASFAEGASVGIWDVRSPSKTLSIELRGPYAFHKL